MKRKMTATVGDLIAALSKVPADTPVFGYSMTDECDVCLDVMEVIPGPIDMESEDWETGEPCIVKRSPHYCKGDSHVEEHWYHNGEGPVVFLRELGWRDEEATPNITILIGKEDV